MKNSWQIGGPPYSSFDYLFTIKNTAVAPPDLVPDYHWFLWLPYHLELLDNAYIDTFKTAFIGILLEALPFVLAGALLSSLLRVFIPDEMISRWIPRRPLPAILFACLLGIIFPVCECGMIPLVRRLIHKGMPVYVAIVFILSGPILNPVVYGATMTAFRSHSELAYARMGLAFVVACLIGLIIYATVKNLPSA